MQPAVSDGGQDIDAIALQIHMTQVAANTAADEAQFALGSQVYFVATFGAAAISSEYVSLLNVLTISDANGAGFKGP